MADREAGMPGGARLGLARPDQMGSSDLYYWLLTTSAPRFLAVLAGVYLGVNLLFALAYLACGDGIANARHGSLADAFFFSVQTMATIGYGQMVPEGLVPNLLVTVEAGIGLLGLAMASGLMFARFTRPTAGVRFSRRVVVRLYEGVPTLMFRLGNHRHDRIHEARIHVVLLRDEVSAEGETYRRLRDLVLERSFTPVFSLTWTVIHRIDETSPLHGMDREELAARHAELNVVFAGHHEGFYQEVHTRTSYAADDFVWNARLADIFVTDAAGNRSLDLTRFDEIEPLAPSAGAV